MGKFKRALQWIIKGIPIHKTIVSVGQIAPSDKLHDRNVLITGGASGLGFYMAKKCLDEGANVLIIGRNEQKLINSSALLNDCSYLVFDLTNLSDIDFMFSKAEKMMGGKIDSLINNAGISLHEKDIMHVTQEGFEKQVSTNLKAPYFLAQTFINRCIENHIDNANLLFISSERGLYSDDLPYGIIKAAINSLTQGLARRVLKYGIRVNAVAPGITVSEMTGFEKNIDKEDINLYRGSICSSRVFLPEEVAETVVWLLSDASKCIAGQIIPCDQGNYYKSQAK